MIIVVLIFNYCLIVTSYNYVLPRFVVLGSSRSINNTFRTCDRILCPYSYWRSSPIRERTSSAVVHKGQSKQFDTPNGEEEEQDDDDNDDEIDKDDNKGWSSSRSSSDADNNKRQRTTVSTPIVDVLDVDWEQKVRDMTLSQLWEALDRRRLQYLTTDSRKQLETLLLQSYSMPSSRNSNARPTYQGGKRRSRRRNLQRMKMPTLQSSLWDQLPLADYDYSSSFPSKIYNPTRSRTNPRNDFRYIARDDDDDDTFYYSRTPKRTQQPTSRRSNLPLDSPITSANRTITEDDNDYKPPTAEKTQFKRRSTIPTSAKRRFRPRRVSILPPTPQRIGMRKPSDNNYNTWADKFIQNVDLLLGIDDPYYRKQQRITSIGNGKRKARATYGEGENGEEELEQDATKNMLSMVLFGKPPKPITRNKKVSLWRNRIPSSLFFFVPTNSQNVCTSTLSAALQLSLVGLANLCRWATVQGTLPQPLVVFTLLSSVLAARRKRFLVGATTIIALRTIGEIISSSSTQESNDNIIDANADDYFPPMDERGRRRRRRRKNELLLSPSTLEVPKVDKASSTSNTVDRTNTKQRKLQRTDDETDEENEDMKSSIGRSQQRQRRSKNTRE